MDLKCVVLNRVGILGYFRAFFCPKQGQGFKPFAAALHPNMGQVPPHPPPPAGGGDKVGSVLKFGLSTKFMRAGKKNGLTMIENQID